MLKVRVSEKARSEAPIVWIQEGPGAKTLKVNELAQEVHKGPGAKALKAQNHNGHTVTP